MTVPQIQLIPLRAAIASDQPTTLDVLVKILPPPLDRGLQRPPINLGLVIDRSGSMSGQKMKYAQEAAIYAVQQLLPTDRVSVTIFDDRVESLVPSTLATHKSSIIRLIQGIHARGSTALHEGWVQGSIQVSQYLSPNQLNRVILLSDGLANMGETNPNIIAQDVQGLAQRGVSTTTMGVGNDYDEDLLEAMARSGDGNFYHIESPQQLPDFFQSELMGLVATVGNSVSLGIEPLHQVRVEDVLNHLDKTAYGRLKLPNLLRGNPIFVVVRLKVPPQAAQTDLCRFRLAWNEPEQTHRQVIKETLTLPSVTSAQLAEFPCQSEVQEQVTLLMAARARQEAVQQIDRGDYQAAQFSLDNAVNWVKRNVVDAAVKQEETDALNELKALIGAGDIKRSRKRALYEQFNRNRSRKGC